MSSPSSHKFLPAIAHAVAGSAGTSISTAATYPLDLVNTRLKVQRSLARDGTIPPGETYDGPLDALRSVWRREGGLVGLYAGLGSDLAKSAADSFLFFLFYNWFRARRLAASRSSRGPRLQQQERWRSRRMGAVEELAVGALAGACARALTMPVANVVARIQTAALLGDVGHDRSPTAVLRRLWRERGVAGLWAGYSAALVLTLNPSLTFFLDQALRSALADGEDRPDGRAATFLVAAVSKAVATVATFPFQIAKARLQVSSPSRPSSPAVDAAHDDTAAPPRPALLLAALRALARDNIFTTVARITREEGVAALYDGLGSELLKAFFSHGITMLSKDAIHSLLVRLYFALVGFWHVLQQRRRRGGAHVSALLAARRRVEVMVLMVLGSRSQRMVKSR